MNVNFSVPAGSFLSQVPFLLESRHPVNSSLPVATNCEADCVARDELRRSARCRRGSRASRTLPAASSTMVCVPETSTDTGVVVAPAVAAASVVASDGERREARDPAQLLLHADRPPHPDAAQRHVMRQSLPRAAGEPLVTRWRRPAAGSVARHRFLRRCRYVRAVLLASIPSPSDPFVFHLGPLAPRWYGILLARRDPARDPVHAPPAGAARAGSGDRGRGRRLGRAVRRRRRAALPRRHRLVGVLGRPREDPAHPGGRPRDLRRAARAARSAQSSARAAPGSRCS